MDSIVPVAAGKLKVTLVHVFRSDSTVLCCGGMVPKVTDRSTTGALPSSSRLLRDFAGFPPLILPFGKHLNHLAIKCRDVVGFPARDQIAVADHIFVDPLCPRVLEIGL